MLIVLTVLCLASLSLVAFSPPAQQHFDHQYFVLPAKQHFDHQYCVLPAKQPVTLQCFEGVCRWAASGLASAGKELWPAFRLD